MSGMNHKELFRKQYEDIQCQVSNPITILDIYHSPMKFDNYLKSYKWEFRVPKAGETVLDPTVFRPVTSLTSTGIPKLVLLECLDKCMQIYGQTLADIRLRMKSFTSEFCIPENAEIRKPLQGERYLNNTLHFEVKVKPHDGKYDDSCDGEYLILQMRETLDVFITTVDSYSNRELFDILFFDGRASAPRVSFEGLTITKVDAELDVLSIFISRLDSRYYGELKRICEACGGAIEIR